VTTQEMIQDKMTSQNKADAEALSYEIREITADRTADLAMVSAIHMELLPFGPIAALGEQFIRELGYRVHLRDGSLSVALCEVAGQPAGFVAYTSQSVGFHRSSLRKHFFRAACVLLNSILRDPSILRRLGPALHMVRSRSNEDTSYSGPLGEIVTIAVRPHFLSSEIVERLGCRLSEELLVHAVRSLCRDGVTKLRGIIDADNRAPLIFYRRLGARLEPYEDSQRPQMQMWLDDLPAFLASRSAAAKAGSRARG
jgi:hypothetical protein